MSEPGDFDDDNPAYDAFLAASVALVGKGSVSDRGLYRAEMARRAKAGIWTQRDGTPIAVKDMGDRHLRNAHAMLRRKGFIGPGTLGMYLRAGPTGGLNGDGAQMAFESEFNAVLEAPVSVFVDLFEEEAKRRGIKL